MYLRFCDNRYATLNYCLKWPAAMDSVLAAFDFLAMDVVSETKLPCEIKGFNYYTRVKFAVFSPMVLMALAAVGGIAWRWHLRRQRRKTRKGGRRSHDASTGKLIKDGLWTAAPFALFILDLIWPAVTRALLQYFSCRDLGSVGFWLEADYRQVISFAS